MIGDDAPIRRRLVLPNGWRLALAFVGGLALEALCTRLPGWSGWSGPLTLGSLLLSLLLGVVGRLLAGLPQQGQEARGLLIADLAWFGFWLAALGWESFQPQTVTDCLFSDGACSSAMVPFWGEWARFFLLIFGIWLVVGLALILVGVFVTSIVLDNIRQRASLPK